MQQPDLVAGKPLQKDDTMKEFARLPDGRPVHAITLQGGGLSATVLTLGVIVSDLRMKGVDHSLVLGCADIVDYLDAGRYVGAMVGRYANRIAGARFALDGQGYHLDANFRGRHILHGGQDGIDHHIWQVEDVGAAHATFRDRLADGHMGFPGNMDIRVTVSLSGNALEFRISATSDRPTPCSLAHHGFFNLDGSADICDHKLRIAADHYLPVDDDLIPLPAPASVEGNRFDFRVPRQIGAEGYDHNFCLSDPSAGYRPVAELTGQSGLGMQVETDAPGLQIYDGAHFDGLRGLQGRVYGPRAGVALETQHWPDAPNRPDFPNSILRPGQVYSHRVAYRFQQG